jgi:hypothetical protein
MWPMKMWFRNKMLPLGPLNGRPVELIGQVPRGAPA